MDRFLDGTISLSGISQTGKVTGLFYLRLRKNLMVILEGAILSVELVTEIWDGITV